MQRTRRQSLRSFLLAAELDIVKPLIEDPDWEAKGANLLRYVLAWFALLVLAVANGALRQFTFGKHMSELRAHQLSTLTGSALIGIFIWLVIRTWPPSSSGQALLIGLIWLVLTVTFEFFMGLVLARRPLRQVLHDYNLAAGRVWVLFLIWLTLAPWVFYLGDAA